MCAMNLADPELELIDPTPNIHVLFLQFDKIFFWAKLASRAVVRWSKRMYSCAGICSYDRGGLCDIALSEPLLKLRPRKDLVETLLHEMIHAFLFITCRDQDRDGHGPNFKAHMFRINKAAGINISIYHDFHDEVKLYQTHWWRCNGPCQTKRPHFGIVRRSTNRAPGPYDYWWKDHQRRCGGDFIKVKEPEKTGKKQKGGNKTNIGDITKYITNNNNKTVGDRNKPTIENVRPVLKDSNLNKPKVNNNVSLVVSKKNNIGFNPQIPKAIVNSNNQTVGEKIKQTSVSDIVETVRNVWANKNLPTLSTVNKNNNISKSVPKRSSTIFDSQFDSGKSPPKKIKKIDDYFKSTATNVLKDIYGHDFNVTQSTKDDKLIAVPVKIDKNLLDCPVCNIKISSDEVNTHLDECLNRDIIEKIGKDSIKITIDSVISSNNSIIDNNVRQINDCIDLTNLPLKTIKNEEYPMTKINIPNKIDSKLNIINKNEVIKKPETFVFDEIVLNTKEEKVEAGSSKISEYNCPCCGNALRKPIEEHLDECLAFFDNNTTIPEEGASTSFSNETILIDDDDINDETLTFNATGTKSPCPCCMKMIEMADMNDHLDICLGCSFS